MREYSDIIERLERATGAQSSTELARLCWQPFKGRPDDIELSIRLEQALSDELVAIGAAVWLVERLLPDWLWKVNAFCDAEVWRNRQTAFGGTAATPALALLLALFRALRDAQHEEREP